MAYHLVPCDREQGYLMPPSLVEWLLEGDLGWFILDVVEQMDLREFYGAYREDGWGAAAYDPGSPGPLELSGRRRANASLRMVYGTGSCIVVLAG